MRIPIFGVTVTALALARVVFGQPGVRDSRDLQSIQIDRASIGGIVRSSAEHVEAGVWVIAETSSLPTHFRRIVVTDDRGRFVIPDLPNGSYTVWVRGYGLEDSTPVEASRGHRVALTVSRARSEREAARIYPSNYWLSLYEPPTELISRSNNSNNSDRRGPWIANMKLACIRCHQFGSAVFQQRTTPEAWADAWTIRPNEARAADWLGRDPLTSTLAGWSSRIAHGTVPPQPPRPAGVEQNVVITQWEWGRRDSYIHDEISTDKRNPSLYRNGRVWGVDFGQDLLWALDPTTHRVSSFKIPTANVLNPPAQSAQRAGAYHNPANPHVPTLDDTGKVWIAVQTRRERTEDRPKWAADVIVNVNRGNNGDFDAVQTWNAGTHHRQLAYFDTRKEQFVLVDTVFGTNHLQFDRQGRLWTSGDTVGLGMLDPGKLHPEQSANTASQAQTAYVSIDRKTGTSFAGGGYGITVDPAHSTIWRTNAYIGGTGGVDSNPDSSFAGENKIIRFDPQTLAFKDYPLPAPGRGPIGIDATTDGKVWFGTASGHLGRFDPATERFTYWESPGPKIAGTGSETGSADFHYSIFVDRFNAFGLGKDIVILTGSNSDALLAFDPSSEHFTVIRVPYPMAMYQRGVDGRIDDPGAGWKGRGLWATYGNDPISYVETQIGCINHIQLRPTPLAY